MAEEILHCKAPLFTLHPRQILLGKKNELLAKPKRTRKEESKKIIQSEIAAVDRKLAAFK